MKEYTVKYRKRGESEIFETMTWGDSVKEVRNHSKIELEGYTVVSVKLNR